MNLKVYIKEESRPKLTNENENHDADRPVGHFKFRAANPKQVPFRSRF